MKFLVFLTTLIMTFVVITESHAINVRVERRDLKLRTQALLEHDSIDNAILADDDRVLNDQATSASATTTATTFLAQPDVCRGISITPGGTTADVPEGDIVVSGTNIFGASISETFSLAANESSKQEGAKAFCTVTSILFPIQDGAGATYDVGVNDVLGLNHCMAQAGDVAWAVFDGVYEATRPTCVADADEVEKNTCDINGTLNGAKDIDIYYIQNFACFP